MRLRFAGERFTRKEPGRPRVIAAYWPPSRIGFQIGPGPSASILQGPCPGLLSFDGPDRANRAATAATRPAAIQGWRHRPRSLPGDRGGGSAGEPRPSGIVIKRQGSGVHETFTVRKRSFGVGVERTFPVHSPKIEKIEVQAIGDVDRAKLYYLRAKVGKKARVREVQRGPAVSSPRADDEVQPDELAADEPVAEEAVGDEPAAEEPVAAVEDGTEAAEVRPEAGRALRRRRRRGRSRLAQPALSSSREFCWTTSTILRDHRVRPLTFLNDSEAGEPGAAGGAVPRRARVRDPDLGADDLAGRDQPRGSAPFEPRGPAAGRRTRLRRRPRHVSSTASASGRRRLRTGPSSTVTRRAPRSPQPRSSPRSFATGRCGASTRSTRATASRHMSGTSRRVTPGSCGSAARARSTGAPSRRSAISAKKSSPGSQRPSTRAVGTRAERRALWHYRLRGYRILATNAWAGGYELDLVVSRVRTVVFCEVKAKGDGRIAATRWRWFTAEKKRRIARAAEAWLAAHPELSGCEARFDVVAERKGRLERVANAF